jgi:capsular polysaccharide biosynthesis protein
VNVALEGGVYAKAAAAVRVPAGALATNTTLGPPVGLALFSVQVVGSSKPSAARLANAVCDAFVSSIRAQRVAETAAQKAAISTRVGDLEREIARLASIPPPKRTVADNVTLSADRQAVTASVTDMAFVQSLPPDKVYVVTPATTGTPYDPRSKGKNLLIALVAGLLACFLFVLVGEILAERRRRATFGSTGDLHREDIFTRP